ncbi:MAG: type II toxin-antitoxin system VapC family toxin [Verrucomicrobiales bacterium]
MSIVDLTLLIAAVNTRAPMHKAARDWWEAQLNSSNPIGLSWLVVLGFIRLSTHPKIFPDPMPLADAIALMDRWMARPNVQILQVTSQHWNILQNMLHAVGHGSTLTTDAHLACLSIEHDCEILTADEDFSHFPGVRWRNPLKPQREETPRN